MKKIGVILLTVLVGILIWTLPAAAETSAGTVDYDGTEVWADFVAGLDPETVDTIRIVGTTVESYVELSYNLLLDTPDAAFTSYMPIHATVTVEDGTFINHRNEADIQIVPIDKLILRGGHVENSNHGWIDEVIATGGEYLISNGFVNKMTVDGDARVESTGDITGKLTLNGGSFQADLCEVKELEINGGTYINAGWVVSAVFNGGSYVDYMGLVDKLTVNSGAFYVGDKDYLGEITVNGGSLAIETWGIDALTVNGGTVDCNPDFTKIKSTPVIAQGCLINKGSAPLPVQVRTADGTLVDWQIEAGGQLMPRAVSMNPVTAVPDGKVGEAYTLEFSADSALPVTWRCDGGIPEGLVLDAQTGVLAGIPEKGGDYTLTVQAVNPFGYTSEQAVTVQIEEEVLSIVGTGTPSAPEASAASHSGTDNPQTGDETPFGLLVLLTAISGIILWKSRRTRVKE